MVFTRSHTLLILAMALAMPGLVCAQEPKSPQPVDGKTHSQLTTAASGKATTDTTVGSNSENITADAPALESALSLVPVSLLPANTPWVEPVLIHFERERNRFVGDVDMEHFLRPGLVVAQKKQAATGSSQVAVTGIADGEKALSPNDQLRKKPVFNWSLSSLLEVSLDVIAARGIQTQAATNGTTSVDSGAFTGGVVESGKDTGGIGFSYAPPASSIATANRNPGQTASTAFSLEGYQLGLRSSLDLGDSATLGFDFGLGQALSRDLGHEESQQMTVTSLGIGLGHKRFRASVNSDVFMNNSGQRLGQQSTLGVQFDWQFDDSTLSVGARRPLVSESGQAERDFSSTIPYIRYRKDL